MLHPLGSGGRSLTTNKLHLGMPKCLCPPTHPPQTSSLRFQPPWSGGW